MGGLIIYYYYVIVVLSIIIFLTDEKIILQGKVKRQISRAQQPALTGIHINWVQHDNGTFHTV